MREHLISEDFRSTKKGVERRKRYERQIKNKKGRAKRIKRVLHPRASEKNRSWNWTKKLRPASCCR